MSSFTLRRIPQCLFWALAALLALSGCDRIDKPAPVATDIRFSNDIEARTVIVDSCEYVVFARREGIAAVHSPNCNNCNPLKTEE